MEKNTFPNIKNEVLLKDGKTILSFINFIQNKRVIVDLGCGHGDFLIYNLEKDRESAFVGIEISRKRAYKTSERLAKRNFTNFAIINCSGELALKVCFPSESIDELHILFPDPWLKKDQWKNRILKPSFLVQALRTLKKGGKIFFVTDIKEYAKDAFELLNSFDELRNFYVKPIETNLYSEFPTLYYRKMSPLREINYICFEKSS